jgi:hypothetical protein
MGTSFISIIQEFLDGHSLDYKCLDSFIVFKDHDIVINAVEMLGQTDNHATKDRFPGKKVLKVYEDLWYSKGDIVRSSILANLNRGGVIYARRCIVRELETDTAFRFLESNHILGGSKSRFRYGLFYNNELVAVATFSQSRPIQRGDSIVSSYEWLRYASLGSLRVTGGMGRLMNFFVKARMPQEIMSYADMDWSDGDAYIRLGFEEIGKTPPIEFFVNRDTFERFSKRKLLKDRKYRNQELCQKDLVLLVNSGNLKFIKRFPIL